MNIYLKSAVQNLDCEIRRLQEIRGQLLDGSQAPTLGVDVFPPQPPVQTYEAPTSPAAVRKALESGPRARLARKLATQGVRKSKIQNPKSGGAAIVAPARAVTPTQPDAGKMPAAPSGERAKTLGGAMKLIIGRLGTFTLESIKTALEAEYGQEEFVRDAGSGSMYGNLAYWVKTEKLDKAGDGSTATFKMVDAEFFGSVEFK